MMLTMFLPDEVKASDIEVELEAELPEENIDSHELEADVEPATNVPASSGRCTVICLTEFKAHYGCSPNI